MKIFDIEQQTEEWYSLRYGKVGGSTLKDVMSNLGKPVRNNAIYPKLLSAKLEPFEFEEAISTKEMEHGNMYEAEARLQFERITGKEVNQFGWIEKENGLHGLSPDGIIGEFEEAIEIKCPSASTHTAYIQDESQLLSSYVWQIANYFAVLPDLKTLYMVSYRPMNEAKPIIIIEVTKDTVINYSSKCSAPVSELTNMINERISELCESLKKDVQLHSF